MRNEECVVESSIGKISQYYYNMKVLRIVIKQIQKREDK